MTITIRKLETSSEHLEAEKLIATSFLHQWDEDEFKENADHPHGDVWAAFDKSDHMTSAIQTLRHDMTYEGGVISCGELHMAGTLPEARGSGAITSMIRNILQEYKDRGDLFALLIPFSFSFYRKYGFEAISETLFQKAGIQQFAGFKQEFTAHQILSQDDVNEARKLYQAFFETYNLARVKTDGDWTYNLARVKTDGDWTYNLARVKTDGDWTYHDNREFGKRDWMYSDKPHYSYLFRDSTGTARAYLTFVFIEGPKGPFTGTMALTDLVYDSPEALSSVFGFFYSMRAKITHVSADLPREMDWGLLLPECDQVERKLNGHFTARALNIEKILTLMKQPDGTGRYSIRIIDDFLPDNTGTYNLFYANGELKNVHKAGDSSDLEMTVETFCMLAVGLIDFNLALYRPGTRLYSNRKLLEKVFVKKPVFLQ